MTRHLYEPITIPSQSSSPSEWQQFGSKLVALLKTITPSGLDRPFVYGWCGSLAIALKQVFGAGAELRTVVCSVNGYYDHACHIFVRYGEYCIDGNGVTTDVNNIFRATHRIKRADYEFSFSQSEESYPYQIPGHGMFCGEAKFDIDYNLVQRIVELISH